MFWVEQQQTTSTTLASFLPQGSGQLGGGVSDYLSASDSGHQRTKWPGCGKWNNSWEQQITAGGGRYKGWQQQAQQLEAANTTAKGNKEASQ
jgi:hypothetical protein